VPQASDRDARQDSIELRLFAARELRAHGYAGEAKKRFDEAVSLFWPAAAREPASLDERRRKARAVYETGDDQRSRALFESILATDSTDAEAMGRLGAIAARAGDRTTVQLMETKLERLRGQYLMGRPLRWQATIAAAQGKTVEAMRLLEDGVRKGYRLLDNPANLTIHLDRDFVGIEETGAYKAMLESLTDASK